MKNAQAWAFSFALSGAIFILFDSLRDLSRVHASSSNKINLQTQSNGIQVFVNGLSVGLATALNFVSGTGIVQVCAQSGSQITCTPSSNTATMVTKPVLQSGVCDFVLSSNGTSAYTYAFGPAGCQTLTAYTKGMHFRLVPDVTNASGTCSLNIDKVSGASGTAIKQPDGATDPPASSLLPGREYGIWFDGTVFRLDNQVAAP